MTECEAIKELHEIRPRGGIIPQKRAEAIDMAINALEKQIPNKPVKKSFIVPYEGINVCPSCKEPLGGKRHYCSKCGQKLDWSDEECDLYE